MAIDPNWLYSATAQSAAAIVAILGGFITSRVLTLNAEKRSLKNQYEEATQRLSVLEQQEHEAYDLYQTMKVERFFTAIADDLREEDQLLSFEQLVQRYPEWDLDHEVLRREYATLAQNTLEAREFIEQHFHKIEIEDFVSFENWVKKHDLDTSDYDKDALEKEYYRVRQREEKVREQRGPAYLARFLGDRPELPTISPLFRIQPEYDVYRRERQDRQLERIQDRLHGLRYELLFADNEVKRLRSRLDAFAYPANLIWGFAALGYLALVGVVFPLVLLPSEGYSPTLKQLTVWLFGSGLAAVLIYIGTQIRELVKK